jgi:hypothetical protein
MVLSTYLNDHLAGATAGCDLVGQLDGRFRDTPHGPVVSHLRREIEEDRASLEELMDQLGIPTQRVKQAVGWVAEKLARLKLSDPVAGGGGLGPLLAMEALGAGILAKAAMWQNLRAVCAPDPRLRAEELERLEWRATEQLEALRRVREAYAQEVLHVPAGT